IVEIVRERRRAGAAEPATVGHLRLVESARAATDREPWREMNHQVREDRLVLVVAQPCCAEDQTALGENGLRGRALVGIPGPRGNVVAALANFALIETADDIVERERTAEQAEAERFVLPLDAQLMRLLVRVGDEREANRIRIERIAVQRH